MTIAEIAIKGTITDSQTGETLPGANIYVSAKNGDAVMPSDVPIGTASDGNGNYTLLVSRFMPKYITASYVGYGRETKRFSGTLNFALKPGIDLPEFEVKAKRKKTVKRVLAGVGIVAGVGILLLLLLQKGNELKPPGK